MSITEIDVLDEIEIDDAPAGTLSPMLQSIARNYLATRARAGAAILESARYLAEARAAAKYGEWGIFLEATGTQEDTATRMLAIAERASTDPQYARAVSDGRLALTAAYEILGASAEVQQRALESETPTPASTIRKAKQESKLRTSAEFVSAPALPLSEDEQHRETILYLLQEARIKGERTGTKLYEQAYAHAREIHDLTLHNKMIALIDRATDEPDTVPAPPADNAAEYRIKESRDAGRIERARTAIEQHNYAAARAELDQVEVATYRRDQLLATIPAGRQITLALTADDCAALLKEARFFANSNNLTKTLPTIGQTLILLVEAIKGAS